MIRYPLKSPVFQKLLKKASAPRDTTLDRKAFPPFLAASLEHVTAVSGAHTDPESVRFFPLSVRPIRQRFFHDSEDYNTDLLAVKA